MGTRQEFRKPDMEVQIAGVKFKNPVWVASGTFGNGREFEEFIDVRDVGAVITKTITLESREGNDSPRVVETPSGLLNSIGLENKGVDHFTRNIVPYLRQLETSVIVSIAGNGTEEYGECAQKLCEKYVPEAIELNLSCPNVAHGGTKHRLMSQDPTATERTVREVKKRVPCPVIAKLTPNVTSIADIASAAEAGGADAVSAVNTYMGMAVDPYSAKPILGNVVGGLSGPAIKPLALKSVKDVYNSVNVPVVGIGGIMKGTDVIEFLLCGASAVQVGTANLADPDAHARILKDFERYLRDQKIGKAGTLTGKITG